MQLLYGNNAYVNLNTLKYQMIIAALGCVQILKVLILSVLLWTLQNAFFSYENW